MFQLAKSIKGMLAVVIMGTVLTALFVPLQSVSAVPAAQAPVGLGLAGNFVALAKSGISTTGTTAITGDIGVSPIAATAITGFGLIMDSTNTFSRSSLVTGKVYAANYADPTPSYMTTAISNMETAYTDAAGRAIPDSVDLGAGNIGGLTLVPGLYKWGTGVSIPTNVTLSGPSSGVWIFQIAGTLVVNSSVHVNLTGGASASNIFWQVAGQTTLGTSSVMNGIILDQTAIVMNTGSSLTGRALAQTAVTMDSNAVVKPAIVVPPTVTSTIPASGAIGVAINSALSANFSTAMNSSTITPAGTFTLKLGSTPVTGTVTYGGLTATFQPTVNLASSTTYTATISTAAQDLSGTPLAAPYSWSFTTGTALDTTPPTVISTIPANAAIGVVTNSAMTATFSEAMNPLTVLASGTFTLKQGINTIAGTVTYIGVIATFQPAAPLAGGTLYTATISTAAQDLAGNALAAPYSWSFTTGAGADITPPTVISTVPSNGATGVALNSSLNATFSEAMNPVTITSATFTLAQGVTPIAGTVTYLGTVATFHPTANLSYGTVYTATITTGATDLAGNALTVPYVWTFTTRAAPSVSVGGNAYPINTTTILVSALILAFIVTLGASVLVLRRRASR